MNKTEGNATRLKVANLLPALKKLAVKPQAQVSHQLELDVFWK